MRKLKLQAQATRQPTIRTQQTVVPFEQAAFAGVYRDILGSKLPETAIARAINAMCMGETADGRPGTKAWSTMAMPLEYQYESGRIVVRDDLELAKSGTTVTRIGGHPFLSTDVGKYIVWPDGGRDRIMTFGDADHVGVRLDTIHLSGVCSIQGGIHCKKWSEKNRKLVVQLGERVYCTDYLMTNWVEVINRSMADAVPAASASTMSESQGIIYLFNENGVWRINPSATKPEMFRMNAAVGESTITQNVQKASNRFGRRYLTTLTKISGAITEGGRLGGAAVEKETMACALRSDQIDYSEVWFPHGLIDGQNGSVVSMSICDPAGKLSNFRDSAKPLHGFSAYVTDWSSKNSDIRNVVMDLHNVSSYQEIADLIQKEMRKVFYDISPNCECRAVFETVSGDDVCRFVFNAEPYGPWAMPLPFDTGASPVSDLIQDINGSSYLNAFPSAVDEERITHVVSGIRGILSARAMAGATHYGIYSTKNMADPVNNTELYVLNGDLPVAKAFLGHMASGDSEDGGIYTVVRGTFTARDVGDVLRFDDGSEATILELTSATEVLTDYSGAGWYLDTPSGLGWMDAVPGRIMRASVAGYMMTKSGYNASGDDFQVSDVGKFVYWDDGSVSQIKEFVSATEVILFESSSKSHFACVIDPGSRNFNDVTTDDTLVARTSVYPLPTRFWIPLPSSPLGILSGGFMFMAPKDSSRLFYCQMPFSAEFVAGHYRADYQYHDFDDVVRWMIEFPNMIAVGCSRKTYRIETNASEFVETPEVGESIAVITGAAIVSDKIGSQRQSSVYPIDNMTVVIFTSDNEVRAFNGAQFGENMAIDQDGRGMMRADLEKLHPDVSFGYDPLMGIVIWGTNVDY